MNNKLDKTARITSKENELLKFIRAMEYDPLEVRKVLMKYHLAILPDPAPAAAKPEPNQAPDQNQAQESNLVIHIPDQVSIPPLTPAASPDKKPIIGSARIITNTYTCPKCKSTNNDIQKKSRYYGLYCADCGRWLRWIASSKVLKD